MWQCPLCSETHEDVFDACWHCGFEREGVEEPLAELPPDDLPLSPRGMPSDRLVATISVLIVAVLICAVVKYSLLASGLALGIISELAIVFAVFCVGLWLHSRRRCRFQYSLRTLLLAVLVASIGMSCLTVTLHGVRRRREAVETIMKTGGSVQYDYHILSGGVPPGPAVLRRLLGDDFFAHVKHVAVKSDAAMKEVKTLGHVPALQLMDGQVTDAATAYLGELPQLEFLYLNTTRVTDTGLEHLKPLTRLGELRINGGEFTYAGLENLKELSELRRLWLTNTGISEAGLESLEGLARLELLYLDGTPVTNAGLAHIRGLHRLNVLSLRGSPVTDAGLKHLEGLTRLEFLCLENTQITDAGLKHLEGLTRLVFLNLDNTQITDAGLTHLKTMTRLQQLLLLWTQATAEGAKKFQQTMPNCMVKTTPEVLPIETSDGVLVPTR